MFKLRQAFFLIIMLSVTLAAAGCSQGFSTSPPPGNIQSSIPASGGTAIQTPTNGLVQSGSAGAVTINVKWRQASQGSLTFDVSMDTHSVDLDQYDLGKLSVLRDDSGREYRPASWNSAAGGHHREGSLAFPLPDSVSQGTAKYLELVIRDIAGVKETKLKWEMKQG